MTKLQTAAKWYADRLTTGKRASTGEDFIKFEDDLPKHEADACRTLALAAHDNGSVLPDDWRYQFISEALDALAEYSDPDEIQLEADIYTNELTSWLGSRNDRMCFCDEAAKDYGETGNMATRIMLGQLREKEEVLAAVRAHLEEEIENVVEEDEVTSDA